MPKKGTLKLHGYNSYVTDHIDDAWNTITESLSPFGLSLGDSISHTPERRYINFRRSIVGHIGIDPYSSRGHVHVSISAYRGRFETLFSKVVDRIAEDFTSNPYITKVEKTPA